MRRLPFIAAGFMLFVIGCQPVHAPLMGIIYLDVKGPIMATDEAGTKEGKACAQSILGLVATGDASIEAAKKAGGIQQVSYIDHHSTSILGVVAEFCTIVKGK